MRANDHTFLFTTLFVIACIAFALGIVGYLIQRSSAQGQPVVATEPAYEAQYQPSTSCSEEDLNPEQLQWNHCKHI